MLVDNRVFGDSRVTKSARSALEAGYDVVVIGVASKPLDTTISSVPVLLRPGKVKLVGPTPLQRVAALLGHGSGASQRAAAEREGRRRAQSKARIESLKRTSSRYNPATRLAGRAIASGLAATNIAARRLHQLRSKASRFAERSVPAHATTIARLERRAPAVVERFGAWEHLDPWPQRYRDGWLAQIIALEPDIIYAHDYRTLPAAVAARKVLAGRGRQARVIYDSHEFVQGLEELGQVRLTAAKRLERTLIRQADAVVTVSEPISEMIRSSYHLPVAPPVVLNAPERPPGRTPGPTLRERCHVGPDTPLLVYSGSVGRARALDMCVDALALLPDVHLALVVGAPNSSVIEELATRAEAAGTRDRLHLTRYVPQEYIVDFVSSATAGLIPFRRNPNNEHSLPTKAREYLVAGVPQIVSDVRELSRFVSSNRLGEVYVADDVQSFAEAVRRLLKDPESYRKSIDPELSRVHSWAAQAPVLIDVFDRLVADLPTPPARASVLAATSQPRATPGGVGTGPMLPAVIDAPVRAVIGPSNSAGQATAWARAAERHLDGVACTVVTMDHGNHFRFPTDRVISTKERTSSAWVAALDDEVSRTRTHVLLESGATLSGSTIDPVAVADEVGKFEEAGLAVGLVLHGSEVRDPQRHRATFAWSNFHDAEPEWLATLQKRVDTTLPLAEWLGVPTFVSTPDLLDYVPWATWLPVTVDIDRFGGNDAPPLLRERPVVLHAPSQAALKGTQHIDPVLHRLEAEGLVEYRRLAGVDPMDMPAHVKDADIVLDQVGMGLYGMLSCEGMAAGRLVVAQVGDVIRARIQEPIPIVEASPACLESVIRSIVRDRDAALETARTGPAYVRTHHDGRAAANALSKFLSARR